MIYVFIAVFFLNVLFVNKRSDPIEFWNKTYDTWLMVFIDHVIAAMVLKQNTIDDFFIMRWNMT